MITTGDVASFLQTIAPLGIAAPWDNVGLLLGRQDAPVERLMTCLTVTPETSDEAIREHAELIVSHHPIFFRAFKRLTDSAPEESRLLELTRHGVVVYSPHTAFDNAPGGINDIIVRDRASEHRRASTRRRRTSVQDHGFRADRRSIAGVRRVVCCRCRPHRRVQTVQLSLERHRHLFWF